MEFTAEQYAVMEKLSSHLIWDSLDPPEKHILLYFDTEKIAEPRAYIEEGLWVLSEKGKRILAAHHSDLEAREQAAQNKAREKAEQESQQRSERSFQIRLMIYGAIVGTLISNIDRIIKWIISLF